MGFRRQPYKLTWPEGSRWHGLEVCIKDMSIGELEEIASIKEKVGDDTTALAKAGPVLDILERGMVSWNYEDEDGKPIPISKFRKQGLGVLMAIISGWTEVTGNVPTPLSQNSSDGKPSEEAQIPMEIPSSSLPI